VHAWTSDRFPSTVESTAAAAAWITTEHAKRAAAPQPEQHAQLAIEVNPGRLKNGDIGGVVGGIGVLHREDVRRRSKEVGIWLSPAAQGCGVGRCALDAFVSYVWTAWPETVRLDAIMYSHNAPSRALFTAARWHLEGVLRAAAFKDGVLCDSLVFSLLRPGLVYEGVGSGGEDAAVVSTTVPTTAS
jgi:RimJ/RimL family protein N-acetyltransferase